MTHQNDVLSAQEFSCLRRCVRARIVVVKSDPSSAVFLISELTVLRWSSVMIATHPVFAKKQAIIWLEVLFCWILLLALLETPIQSTAVYFRTHTHT